MWFRHELSSLAEVSLYFWAMRHCYQVKRPASGFLVQRGHDIAFRNLIRVRWGLLSGCSVGVCSRKGSLSLTYSVTVISRLPSPVMWRRVLNVLNVAEKYYSALKIEAEHSSETSALSCAARCHMLEESSRLVGTEGTPYFTRISIN